MSKYLFDTSVWIWAFNEAYPMDVFACVWAFFEKEGTIHYIEEIKKELSQKDDKLNQWFKKTNSLKKISSVDPSDIINKYYTKNLEGATVDAKVIATAKKEGMIVVSAEKYHPQQIERLKQQKPVRNVKMPNVCKLEGIKHYNIVNFWKEEAQKKGYSF